MRRSIGQAQFSASCILVATITTVVLLSGVNIAGAQQSGLCSGDTVVVFPDARLLNADGSRTAGPFVVSLAPGVYLVTAASFDAHGVDQVSQPQEQWRMVADSGWSSPATVDIADTSQTAVSTFNGQIIDSAVSSLTLSHLAEGGINSVTPVCAGFTRLASVLEPEGAADANDGADPESGESGAGPVADGTTDAVVPDEDPVADGTTDAVVPDEDPVADGTTDAAEPAPGEPAVAAPTGDDEPNVGEPAVPTTAAPVAPSPPDSTPPGPAPSSDEIVPEVGGITETAPALARTGPDPLTQRLLGLGLLLVAAGGLTMAVGRRHRLQA